MPSKDFDTRAAIMKSGMAEFLKHGFRGASLRTICANARVTTGAFYAHFEKKEDLFSALVQDDLADYFTRYDSMMDRLTAQAPSPEDNEIDIMLYLLERRDLFKLLFDCSEGTEYEGFKDRLLRHFEESYQAFFDAYATEPLDRDIVKVIVQMKFTQYMTILYGGFPPERVREIMERMQEFTRGGFEALIGAKMGRPA